MFVCIDVFGKQKEIISKICSSCNGCVWECVWVCLCWLRLLCFVRSVVMKMEIRFGFPLRAFGERVWNCQKSYETFILFSFLLLLLFLLFDALLRTTRGRGRRRELPLVALLQTLCICQADCPHAPSFSPRFAPFLLATRILSALLFFPSRILSLFLPFCLLFIIHLLWNWINFCLVAHSLFWHSNAFGTYVSLFWLVYCTQQIDMCSNGSHKMCKTRWRTPRRPATFGEFAFWIVEKAISLFCQAIHWKVSSGKHSALSSHPSLWLSTKAFKVLWNLFYSHFIFSGDFLAFFLSLFSISIHFPLCCSYSRWRNAKIMIKMAVCLLLVRILLFIWKLCEKSRARQTESETETDKGHRLCGAFQ